MGDRRNKRQLSGQLPRSGWVLGASLRFNLLRRPLPPRREGGFGFVRMVVGEKLSLWASGWMFLYGTRPVNEREGTSVYMLINPLHSWPSLEGPPLWRRDPCSEGDIPHSEGDIPHSEGGTPTLKEGPLLWRRDPHSAFLLQISSLLIKGVSSCPLGVRGVSSCWPVKPFETGPVIKGNANQMEFNWSRIMWRAAPLGRGGSGVAGWCGVVQALLPAAPCCPRHSGWQTQRAQFQSDAERLDRTAPTPESDWSTQQLIDVKALVGREQVLM